MALKKINLNPFATLNQAFRQQGIEPDVARSLRFMICSNIMGTFFGTVCGAGTNTMIDMANNLHAGDLAFGILNAIPQVAVLLQLPAAMLVNWTQKRKKYLLTYGLISRFLWLIIGLVPLIMPMSDAQIQMWTILFLLGVSSALSSVIQVCWFPWLGDLAPMRIRSQWFSTRGALNSTTSIIVGLVTAWLLDTLPAPTKYAIIFGIGATAGMVDMILFGFCKEVYPAPPVKPSLKSMGKDVFGNKLFMQFMIFWTLWCFSANFSGAYLTRYVVSVHGVTYMQVAICGTIASSLMTVLMVGRWGRLANQYGTKPVLMVSCIVASLTQLFFLLCYEGAWWPMLLHNVIGAAFWCAGDLMSQQLQLDYSHDENRASCIAMFACVTALAGTFLGVMSGGYLLEWMQQFTFPKGFDRYKMLTLIGCTLRFIIVLLFVPRLKNNREYNTKDMIRGVFSRNKY